jgi:hypothetical protein
MWKFIRQFAQSNPQVLKAVQGFGSKAAPALKSVADQVTDPQTYRALAGQAERVLQKPLPQAFAGTGFGNIPTRFTGMISDLTNAPAGLARNVQTGMVNRAIQEAAGIVPQLSRTVTQTAEGALRAPAIGTALRTGQSVLTNPLQTTIQAGGQFARDPAARREFVKQFGGTTEKAARALSGQSNFGQVGNIFKNLGTAAAPYLKPSSAFARIPVLGSMPSWAQSLVAPTSVAGTIVGLTQLEGTTPQSGDPYDNWQRLGYSSKDDMLQRVSRQAQIEGASKAFGLPQGPAISPDVGFIGGNPPPAPVLPSPPEMVDRRAGQQISPVAPPVAPGTLSNGAGVPAQRQNVQDRARSQEILNAMQQYAAPATFPGGLSAFYAGQQQLGRSMEQGGELQRRLKELGGAAGMTDKALMEWVEANPGLAYRELLKRQSR